MRRLGLAGQPGGPDLSTHGEDPITSRSARDLAAAIHGRDVSCREVMSAYLARIEALNPTHNAIVSLRPAGELLAEADACDAAPARGERRGVLHGFPLAVKDLVETAGIRTTHGSPLYADHVPGQDALVAARLRAAGAVLIGKTNVAELGFGSQSYNPVFGVTRNALDPALTAGGSSGGAAVSVALLMQPVADGSDSMGSLRNPAAFNEVVGFRPTPGRVPSGAPAAGFLEDISTAGPMGRTVDDVALLLSVLAGPDPASPLSLDEPGSALDRPPDGVPSVKRVGWLGDLDGYLAMDAGLLPVCERALRRLEAAGCVVEPAVLPFAPDLAWEVWTTLRSWQTAGALAGVLRDPVLRPLVKPEVAWEVERGLGITGEQAWAAIGRRSEVFRGLLSLFDRFDALVLPSAQVFPFSADVHWPAEVGGRAMDTYHRWMEVSIYATLGGLPSLAVPAGRDDRGLPAGIQLMGRPRADREVLALGRAYEAAG
jgi:amidase